MYVIIVLCLLNIVFYSQLLFKSSEKVLTGIVLLMCSFLIATSLNYDFWPLLVLVVYFMLLAQVNVYKQGSNQRSALRWLELQVIYGIVFFLIQQSTDKLMHAVSVLALIAAWLALVRIILSTRKTTYTKMPGYTGELPTVSLAIPARNEGRSLTETLHKAVSSDYPKLEILVLDDCSHDRTPEIIRAYANDGVRFIEGRVLEEEWLGRNYALHQLQIAANGEIFIFADVGVHFSKNTISDIVNCMLESNIDLLSVHPSTRDSWKFSSLFNTMRTYWKLLLFKKPIHGQCVAIKTKALNDIGGFESFKDSFYFEAKLIESIENSKAITNGSSLGLSLFKPLRSRMRKNTRGLFPFFDKNVAFACLFAVTLCVLYFVPLALLIFKSSLLGAITILLYSLSYFYLSYYDLGFFSGLLSALLLPIRISVEFGMLLISTTLYSYQYVFWKDRNICLPMYDVSPKLPEI